jgi:hypothetical protein
MFHAKYLSSSSYGFPKEDIFKFFLLVAMATSYAWNLIL